MTYYTRRGTRAKTPEYQPDEPLVRRVRTVFDAARQYVYGYPSSHADRRTIIATCDRVRDELRAMPAPYSAAAEEVDAVGRHIQLFSLQVGGTHDANEPSIRAKYIDLISKAESAAMTSIDPARVKRRVKAILPGFPLIVKLDREFTRIHRSGLGTGGFPSKDLKPGDFILHVGFPEKVIRVGNGFYTTNVEKHPYYTPDEREIKISEDDARLIVGNWDAYRVWMIQGKEGLIAAWRRANPKTPPIATRRIKSPFVRPGSTPLPPEPTESNLADQVRRVAAVADRRNLPPGEREFITEDPQWRGGKAAPPMCDRDWLVAAVREGIQTATGAKFGQRRPLTKESTFRYSGGTGGSAVGFVSSLVREAAHNWRVRAAFGLPTNMIPPANLIAETFIIYARNYNRSIARKAAKWRRVKAMNDRVNQGYLRGRDFVDIDGDGSMYGFRRMPLSDQQALDQHAELKGKLREILRQQQAVKNAIATLDRRPSPGPATRQKMNEAKVRLAALNQQEDRLRARIDKLEVDYQATFARARRDNPNL